MSKVVALRVGSKTDVNSLKTSILGNIKAGSTVLLDTIGVSANYVAIKSIILVRGQLNSCGYSLVANPVFHDYQIESIDGTNIKTGIQWVLEGVKNIY